MFAMNRIKDLIHQCVIGSVGSTVFVAPKATQRYYFSDANARDLYLFLEYDPDVKAFSVSEDKQQLVVESQFGFAIRVIIPSGTGSFIEPNRYQPLCQLELQPKIEVPPKMPASKPYMLRPEEFLDPTRNDSNAETQVATYETDDVFTTDVFMSI